MNIRKTKLALTLVVSTSLSTAAVASTVTGVVRDPSGKARAHVFATAENSERKLAVSVLTDANGGYRLDGLFPGHYEIYARGAGFDDSSRVEVDLGVRDASVPLQLRPDTVHLSTPTLAWLNTLPDGPMKATFLTRCTLCHDPGSPLIRVARSASDWEAIIHQMRVIQGSYKDILDFDDKKLSAWLAENKFGAAPGNFDAFAKHANVVGARVTEYMLGDANSIEHDLAIEPKTGMAWVGDNYSDKLTSVNPRTGEQRSYSPPVRYGGMHTLNFDRDGFLWITFQMTADVAQFDTHTGDWHIYQGFSAGDLTHSFALDSEGYVKKDASGHIYVSLYGANAVAMLDTRGGAVTRIQLPGPTSDSTYGIAVNSKGLICYGKYGANKIGFYDPSTGKAKEIELSRPESGPHRLHIDDNDNVWIPLSGYGSILRYSTLDGSQQEYKLPDADSFPYVLRYDSKSERVWITGNGANSIYALNPKTGLVTTFRLPSPASYGRMISIDYSTGDVWTALSSYPNKLALRDHGILLRLHHALDSVH